MNQPLKIAAISGILILALCFIYGFITSILNLDGTDPVIRMLSMVFLLIITFLSIIYTYGFVILGKKYNAKLLLVMAWIGIIFLLIIFVLFMIGNIISSVPNVNAAQPSQTTVNNPNINNNFNFENIDETNIESIIIDPETGQFTEQGAAIVYAMIVLWIIFSILLGIYTILFGIGLMKLNNDVELSYASGVMNIISGATFIIVIGYFIALATMIVEIVMLFKASNRIEKKSLYKTTVKSDEKSETKKVVKKK